jgi:hypothetical protein
MTVVKKTFHEPKSTPPRLFEMATDAFFGPATQIGALKISGSTF